MFAQPAFHLPGLTGAALLAAIRALGKTAPGFDGWRASELGCMGEQATAMLAACLLYTSPSPRD
eukprot:10581038-Alexandrium_andersonii.AAC.1